MPRHAISWLLLFMSCQPAHKDFATAASATRREGTQDVIHGATVSDPYRWLERGDSEEVKAWMKVQDHAARARLLALPQRAALGKRFKELYYIDSISAPTHRGRRYFFSRKHADREKSVAYYREEGSSEEKVLIDPNALSPDGSIALHAFSPSYDGRYVAYSLSRNNSDEATLHVRDVDTGQDLERDVIADARQAWPSWTPDGKGFYYTWFPSDPAIPDAELPGKAEARFHKLGTDPKDDEVIHPAIGDPTKFLGCSVSRDGRWLLLDIGSWAKGDVYYKDLASQDRPDPNAASTPEKLGFKPLVTGRDALTSVTAWQDSFYIHTNDGAPRYRLYKVSATDPARARWKEIVPERADATLEGVQIVGGRLVLAYLKNAVSEMEVRTLDGEPVRQVELPGLGSSGGMVGNPDEDDAYFYFSSFTVMPRIYRTSIASGETDLWATIEYPADTSAMVTDQVFYPSKDGTRVSMFIIHRKDMKKDGGNPTLLTGYGGFNVSMTPWFSSSQVVWLEHGGVVAIPNLRGGGEYGEEWHRAGMLDRKQNVFDDFIAAAEYLIREGYTRPERLACSGGSNGGLLVSACMVQRPDLYRAVVCAVPLCDMVRYHLAGGGKMWIDEYGSPEDPKMFEALLAYSPYHHVKPGTPYPALLVLSADSDDRVDPMHARKLAAAVAHATGSGRPVLLRVEEKAGHGGADMVKKAVESQADTYAFLLDELGLRP